MKKKARNIKIASICPGSGYINRGAERTIEQVEKSLTKKGHIIDIYGSGNLRGLKRHDPFTITWGNILEKTKLIYLISYIPLPIDEWSSASFWFFVHILFNRKKYDLLWIHTGYSGVFYARIFRFLFKLPFVVTCHCGGKTEISNFIMKPNGMVTQEPFTYELLKRQSKDIIIAFIPSGVDTKIFTSSGSKFSFKELERMAHKPKRKIERPIILSTTAHVKHKRIDLLIKAAAKMKKGTLILTSDGDQKDYLLKLGEELLGNRFLYVGILSNEALAKLYRTCDVFSLPSGYEPFGLVLLEAMASGKPVVTQDDKIRRWVVGNSGILLDLTDINEYAKAIEKAYRQKWGNRPRRQAEKFSWDKAAQKYEKFFLRVINQWKKCQ